MKMMRSGFNYLTKKYPNHKLYKIREDGGELNIYNQERIEDVEYFLSF